MSRTYHALVSLRCVIWAASCAELTVEVKRQAAFPVGERHVEGSERIVTRFIWLRIGFGRESVFRDVHTIGVGKWRDKIDAALAQSAVCVVVIGPRWANADNLPRLEDESDMVRHELVTALASEGLTLVPAIVVAGHKKPGAPDSPSTIQDTKRYLQDFDRLQKTATSDQELIDQMTELYSHWVANQSWLMFGFPRP